jgi:tetratricopeptide (TPR) repeat protein
LNDLAALLRRESKYADAEPLYRRALAILEKQLGPEHPDIARSLNNLALLFEFDRRYAEAEPLYRRALAIYEKQLGPKHPDTKDVRENLEALRKP